MYHAVFLYLRASLADGDEEESNTIINQRKLLHQFLDNSIELKNIRRKEYVDDGYTGTKAKRPALQQMLCDLQGNENVIVITKDFSRLHRDYAEMGKYLECIFPFWGVRYISVNDGYDSNQYPDRTGGMDVVLRNIVYAAYSKDIAVKTSSSRRQMLKEGKYTSGCVLYGYQKNSEKKHTLSIDPEAAAIVRKIYDMALSGTKANKIAQYLNQSGVLTRAAYFAKKYPNQKRYQSVSRNAKWTSYQVIHILQEYQYTGALVGNRRQKAGVLYKETKSNPKDKWIIVEGTHEAIVTKEEFKQVTEIMQFGSKRRMNTQRNYSLKGKLYCGHCKKRLSRTGRENTWLYRCSYAYSGIHPLCRTRKYIGEKELESCVLTAINRIMIALKTEQFRKMQLIERETSATKQREKLFDRLMIRRKKQKKEKRVLYEKYVSGKLTEEEYKQQKIILIQSLQKLDSEIASLEKTLSNACQKQCEMKEVASGFRKLSAEMANAFIKEIYVYPDRRVEIYWNFGSCLTLSDCSCNGGGRCQPEDPCEMFERFEFPVDEFFPRDCKNKECHKPCCNTCDNNRGNGDCRR